MISLFPTLLLLAAPAAPQTVGGGYESLNQWDGSAPYELYGNTVASAGDNYSGRTVHKYSPHRDFAPLSSGLGLTQCLVHVITHNPNVARHPRVVKAALARNQREAYIPFP